MSFGVRAARAVAALALVVAIAGPCRAASETDWSRNPRGFELGIDQHDSGATWGITLRACRQPSCFHARAERVATANSRTGVWEMTLPIAGGACDLKIVNVPYNDMDSNDWRITAQPVSPGGCAGAPAGVGGVYRSERP